MSICNKYSVEERRIASRLLQLKHYLVRLSRSRKKHKEEIKQLVKKFYDLQEFKPKRKRLKLGMKL